MPTNKTIHLGYESETGEPVSIKLHHLTACGMTQLAGKTTAIEALIYRSEMTALAFITKPGESAFSDIGIETPPFYAENHDWRYISSLFESLMGEDMKFERSWIIEACKGTRNLKEFHQNIKNFLANGKIRSIDKSVYTNLDAYLDIIIPQVEQANLASELQLKKGLNVMRLDQYEPELQKLIIASSIECINKYYRGVIVIIPEAWETLPYKGSPVRIPAELFIRKGAAVGNYLWIDSQDIAGVNRVFFRQIDNWLLGRQRDALEVDRNLAAIPLDKSLKPKSADIQQLTLGFFIVCAGNTVKKVYVQPAWLPDDVARSIAKGETPITQIENYKEEFRKTRILRVPETFQPIVKPPVTQQREKQERLDNIYNSGLEDIIRLGEENQALKKELENTRGAMKQVVDGMAHVSEEKRLLENEKEMQKERIGDLIKQKDELYSKLEAYKTIDIFFSNLVDQQVNNKLTELETRLTSKLATQQPINSLANLGSETQLIVESNQSELIVKVNRPPVYINENTLRGQLALIFSENLVNEYRSAASIGKILTNLGVDVKALSKDTSIFKELDWYTSQRILIRDPARGWKVRDKSRIKAEKQ